MEGDSNKHAVEDVDITHAMTANIPGSGNTPRSETNPQTCHHTMTGRNLVVCIDGTSNQFGEKNTNVIELYNLILKEVGDRQRTWYNSGIGTYARPSWKSLRFHLQVLHHRIDLAIAWDFERTVLAAYRWLSDNYEPGDCIFLFGFSRGAFQVRVLSAMIDKVGLIYKGNEMQIPFAYELYSDPKSDIPRAATRVGSQTQEKMSSAERFKKAFSYKNVKVHFVGAWDTVSSIGIARGTHMLPRTVDGMQHVCYFRHALALDERRVKFLPEYAHGGLAKPPGNSEQANPAAHSSESGKNARDKNSVRKHDHTLEVWFAGTHSDIGGGNVENAGMDRSRPPLRWMVFEAGAVGLRTAPFERELSSDEQIQIKESLTGIWKLLEIYPFKRLTYMSRDDGKAGTRKPHLGAHRIIHEGQKIHSSLLLADNLIDGQPYTPKAQPLEGDPNFWQHAREKGLGEWLEQDLYEYVDDLVTKFIDNVRVKDMDDGVILQNLRQIMLGVDGQQAVCDSLFKGVIDTLQKPDSEYDQNKKWTLVKSTMDILMKSPIELKEAHSVEIRSLIRGLPANTEDCQTAKQFMDRCTTSCIYILQGHTHYVASVAFSPDRKRIASGSFDKTIRIWHSETGKQIGDPLRGHTHLVNSVTFSPDGKRIVSGSFDTTVRMWDLETGMQIGTPFQGHTHYVFSVAFSPDGKRIVSGSRDMTLRIWDVETGTQVGAPLQGHTGEVHSVAFSLDGKQVISGSYDETIRLWDSETGMQIGEPIIGHTGSVWSVAFSPDGKHIVSGSWDRTVRIWDLETGKQVGGPFRGHTDNVNSVAFSPDGKRIVSGSDDETVWIWDAAAGEQVGEPLRGHTYWVRSVAFSPDGKRVVSGSDDRTIRIWDADMYQEGG